MQLKVLESSFGRGLVVWENVGSLFGNGVLDSSTAG